MIAFERCSLSRYFQGFVALIALAATAFHPAAASSEELTVYSGRSKTLVGPILDRYAEQSGVELNVRYGDTAEMAATILEEGENSPADVFLAQDAGALGALADAGRLAELPDSILSRVEPRFRSPEGRWVGVSGRARVLVYNTERVDPADLPDSILAFTDPKWKGRIGWAPTNGSFQAHVTAMRVALGEEATREWLRGIIANEPLVYPKNSAIVAAVGAGEVDVGFVNHYYLFRFLEERGPDFPARNDYFESDDIGNLINVAGAAVLNTAANPEGAEALIAYLLGPEAQKYFTDETNEYPLIEGVETNEMLKPLGEIETPEIDLSDLDDLQGTLELLREVGALE